VGIGDVVYFLTYGGKRETLVGFCESIDPGHPAGQKRDEKNEGTICIV